MKISELSPDLHPATTTTTTTPATSTIIYEIESAVKSLESLSSSPEPPAEKSTEALSSSLRRSLSSLSPHLPLPDATNLILWKLAYRLWNACVDLSNSAGGEARTRILSADLRQTASDLLLLAGVPSSVPDPYLKSASFLHKTGLVWHEAQNFPRAADCFEKATNLISNNRGGEERRKLALDVNLARSRTAWEAEDRNLAIVLLNRSKNLLSRSPEAYKELSEQFLQFGKLDLTKNVPDAGKLIGEALDICEQGILAASNNPSAEDLECLKEKCLRFLAAERLQAEDYEGVLKCILVMRKKERGGREHPSVGFIAMKAWIGLGKVAEAERELEEMMGNEDVPENVVVSAAERFLSAAGAERAKGVMVGLVRRCRGGGPAAAVRVVRRVAEGRYGRGRVKVVAELASDERVVMLFEGGKAAKESSNMHALLWNCGAEHFRLKEYEISVEMFEISMLYVPRDEENRGRRSNCFRVLSLCHLALAQLDRAQEFIDQAEKLDPNIRCSFLKFKICLQRKDEKQAINQLQAMVSCVDFNPEYLTLSTHEAIACQLLPVAIASLSILLNLYSPGKLMPMPEVAILRNLVTLLNHNPESQHEILKYTRRAYAKMSELGVEAFFGKGDVGIRELNWFAGNAWNMGLKTGKEKKYEFCAEFFEFASEFYRKVSEESNETNAIVCKCLIISVAAMINSEDQKKVPMLDSDVKKAMDMLERAGKLLQSIFSGDKLAEPFSIFFLHTFNTYELLSRLDDTRTQQLQLIKNFASSKACNPQNLLQLGLTASKGGRTNPEAAEFALNACLSALLASPLPDYQSVGTILRRLISVAALVGKSDEVFGVYRQAYQIIVGLKEGEYPTEEGKWLAMTAWNKSGMAVRLRQVDEARRWMKMGLDLARRVKGMDKYIEGMEESFAKFEKVCSSSIEASSSAAGANKFDTRGENGDRPILP